MSALSDLEVKPKTSESKLYHIKYPLKGKPGEFVEVATTRPETMLGDTAIAVNPEDKRYKGFTGKSAVLPLVGREVPFIEDTAVDPKFGTGAVKVTPAHDLADFEMGQRHNLAQITVIGEDAKITAEGGVYKGLDRFAARKKIVEDLDAQGLLVKVEVADEQYRSMRPMFHGCGAADFHAVVYAISSLLPSRPYVPWKTGG